MVCYPARIEPRIHAPNNRSATHLPENVAGCRLNAVLRVSFFIPSTGHVPPVKHTCMGSASMVLPYAIHDGGGGGGFTVLMMYTLAANFGWCTSPSLERSNREDSYKEVNVFSHWGKGVLTTCACVGSYRLVHP